MYRKVVKSITTWSGNCKTKVYVAVSVLQGVVPEILHVKLEYILKQDIELDTATLVFQRYFRLKIEPSPLQQDPH